MLEAESITVSYGGLVAVSEFSLVVPDHTLVGLIGPNGAGKTSFIDALSGFAGYQGTVRLDGDPLDALTPHQRTHRGLVRTFQSVELFRDLTVLDNLRVQAENATPRGGGRTPPDDEELLEILRTLDLADLAHHWPHELPHGTRRLVGLARALACRPRTLLMDEPGAGLDAAETRDLAARLRRIVDAGQTSILLVDHDMELIMSVCDELYVMNFGELVTHGPPTTVRTDPAVVDAYLGGSAPGAAPEVVGGGDGREPRTDEPVLQVAGLTAGYEGIPVVHDVDLEVRPGEIVALLGPNGAGKTTTLSTISGLIPPMRGDIVFRGESVARLAPHRITRRGLVHVPEDRSLIFSLSTQDNLRLTAWGDDAATDPLALFPEVARRSRIKAGLLSGGEQQMLAVARALVAAPSVLMVDEMSLGLAPVIVERLFATLRTIAEAHGVGVLLVEQHVDLALRYADRGYVLVNGTVRASGPVADLAARWPDIEASYLGGAAEADHTSSPQASSTRHHGGS